ncbi:MAG: hypothetical protein IJT72_01575 [Lachnospiraceae bacterium]|nr:hypothetical protein [Lachnospiraceae bacterium]
MKKDFLKKIVLSLSLVFVFSGTLLFTTGCEEWDRCAKSCNGNDNDSTTAATTEAVTTAATTEAVTEGGVVEDTEATTEAASDEVAYDENGMFLESVEYTGEGTGGDAVYEFNVLLSPELVKKGWSLGDVWAKIKGTPTFDDWDGINTYDNSAEEEDLPDGGKRIKWRTSIYFPNGAPQEGDEVTIGVNPAGQDENGNWTEGEIGSTVDISWEKPETEEAKPDPEK